MINLPKLHDYKMPHLLNRKGQGEAFEAVLKWYAESKKQYMILSAPTGIGKTGILAKMTQYARVMALVRTKVLVDAVYGKSYDFEQLHGKGSHECHASPHTHRADVCALPDDLPAQVRYDECQGSGDCSYYVEYDRFCGSFKAATTYAKFISDRKPYNYPTLYAFDEAHETPEEVIERSGVNLNTKNERRYPYLKGFGDLTNNDDLGYEAGIKIMRRLYATALKNKPKQIKNWSEMTTDEQIRFKRSMIRHRQFLQRIEDAGKLMIQSENDGLNIWHYDSNCNGDFSARPMSAAYHFKHILDTGHHKTLLMSATISPMTAEMLGIKDEELEYYEAPQQFPIPMRTVWDLGIGNMSYESTKNDPALFQIQARKISNILVQRPDASSVILTTSKAKAKRLTENLIRMGGHDVFNPPMGIGTDLQLRAWEQYRKPGAVCVSYNFWEGVSLDLDQMLFIAGLKYPDVSSPFELVRAQRDWNVYYYRGAIYVVQGCGRIQRGHFGEDRNDYLPIGGPGNMVGKMVFLAVGKYGRLANQAPGDFKQRIKPWVW